MNRVRLCVIGIGILVCSGKPGPADTFSYVDQDRNTATLEARYLGSGRGYEALERADGQMVLVPSGGILSREPSEGPIPMNFEELTQRLETEFGPDLVLVRVQRPFLVGLVLASPIDRAAEGRANEFLKKASRFMNSVDDVFLRFAKSKRFPLREPKFPLVLLIFESEDDFNSYAVDATGGEGISAKSIAGFYSGLTNWLAVRMSACDTFEVPLHEAIHQQMYNRVLHRLAPIPKWFDEGIATGFENSGERIKTSPAKVNARYARLARQASAELDWRTVIADDTAFTADILAGDAYTLAWCMHWMLATQHSDSYRDYVQELSRRQTLATLDEDERVQRFEKALGVSITQLEADFPRALRSGVKRQKINLKPPTNPNGRATEQQALGQVNVQAVLNQNLGGQLQVAGTIKNISPLRTMTFYVTVEATSGLYADWVIGDMRPGEARPLRRQVATKLATGATGGPPGSYRVWIRSTVAGSGDSVAWKSGDVPGPVAGQ